MMKLSVFFALFFSFLAFARAEDTVGKLQFGTNLCAQGQPQTYNICVTTLNDRDLTGTSFFRLATDICPAAGGANSQLVLRCFNKANERFGLSIARCNAENTYHKRIHCVQAIITQADNQSLQDRLNGAAAATRGAGRDNSGRSSAGPKAGSGPRGASSNAGAGAIGQ